MNLIYFVDNVVKNSKFLIEIEKINFYIYMVGINKELLDIKFVTKRRKLFFIICICLGVLEKLNVEIFRWRIGELEKLDFKVLKKIEIYGIVVYGGRLEKLNYKVSVWLRKYDTDEVIADCYSKLLIILEGIIYRVFFRKFVIV